MHESLPWYQVRFDPGQFGGGAAAALHTLLKAAPQVPFVHVTLADPVVEGMPSDKLAVCPEDIPGAVASQVLPPTVQ